MDPSDPYQRRSIFPEPAPGEELRAPVQSRPKTFRQDQPMARNGLGPEPTEQGGPTRRLLIGLGAGGLMLLLIGGFVAASILRPADEPALAVASASTSPSPTLPPSISPTPTEAPTITPSPSPTPVPTPTGPPQDVAVGAWATVAVDELNVRRTAGTDSTSDYVLVRGAVVHVAEGPSTVAGLNWYRIASLGGAAGWVTSGWVAEPFLTTLVEDPTLIRCGEVTRPVFDIVDGLPTPHDPITIGEMALPVAAFSDLSLGVIELLRGIGGDACFSAQVGSDGLPAISAQLAVSACGRVTSEGDFYRLRPAAGQRVSPEAQVKDPVVVHPALLVGGSPDDRMSTNLRNVLILIAYATDASGCLYVTVTEGPDGIESYRSIDTMQCVIVHELTEGSISLSHAAGGDSVVIPLLWEWGRPGTLPLGVPTPVAIGASVTEQGHGGYAYQGHDPDCG